MSFVTMTAKDLAARLNGREYLNEIMPEEEREAESNGLVVVLGYSDDNMMFIGAIDDEVGAFEGTTVCIDHGEGVVPVGEGAPENIIKAVWHDAGEPCWSFETSIPHETFNIYEDGELFCVGIVFSMDDLV